MTVHDKIFRVSQFLLRLYFSLFFRIDVRGTEFVPRRGKLLFAANHVSGYDPPLVGCVIPRVVYFMAKKELFRHPLLRALLRFYNCIPVDRGEFGLSTLKKIEKLLSQGAGVLLFPEGTRTKSGQMGRPKLGLGMLAARNRADIVPIFIQGLFGVRGSVVRRPGVTITFGPPLEIEPFLENGKVGKELYNVISNAAFESVQRLQLRNGH